MTWKCSLAELPFGGAKSGIVAERGMDAARKQELFKAFARAASIVSPSIYVAAPDINTAEQEMALFAKINGRKSCTGKPKKMKGIPHELGSTGYGVFHSAKVAIEHSGLDIKKISFAVEGFGNVGIFAAKFLTEHGARLVAASDSKGTIYNCNGISFSELKKIKESTGSVTNYAKGTALEGAKLLELPADVLITAALPNLINEANVEKIQAKIIVEGSNIPATSAIEQRLFEKEILVVPDFVANAGGVISSYVEYIGGSEQKMFKLVEQKIVRNTKIVLENATKQNTKPRDAALRIAETRLRKKMKA
jgi:glutamate dehydrogenase/leucine dehydrogenase